MRRTKKIRLSVVVPVFNEQQRIHNLYRLHAFLKKKNYFYELIVVNDGSRDKTKKRVKTIQKEIFFRFISYIENKGKGYAIQKGVRAARGTHVLFLDIDLSSSLSVLDHMVFLLQKTEIVVGTRKGKGARIVQRQPLLRELLGKTFTWFSQVITGVSVSDFTCGFKCFSLRAVRHIVAKQTIYRWSFDTEFLLIAQTAGFSIKELPLEWKDDKNTKVRFPNDAFVSLKELILIWFRRLLGKYN